MTERPMVGVRIPQQWKEELERIAGASGRPVSQILHDLISQYLQTEGKASRQTSAPLSAAQLRGVEAPKAVETQSLTLLSEQVAQVTNQVNALRAELPEQVALKLTSISTGLEVSNEQSGRSDVASTILLEQVCSLAQRIERHLRSTKAIAKAQSDSEHRDSVVSNRLSQVIERSDMPQSLSTKALARRLGVSDTAIRKAQRNKTIEEFAAWSVQPNPRYGKLADPDGLMWKYNSTNKRFYPISS